MKKLLAIILAAVMVLGLVACGSSSGTGSNAGGSGSGETYDTGVFTITVPSGWKAFEQTDVLGETDSNGDYPVDPNSVALTKGGSTEYDQLTKPTIRIAYQEGLEASSQAELGKIWYDETTDIDVSINGTKCYAFEAKSESFLDEGVYYTYAVVFYPITAKDTVEFTIPVDMVDYAGVNVTDADVIQIMESFTLN